MFPTFSLGLTILLIVCYFFYLFLELVWLYSLAMLVGLTVVSGFAGKCIYRPLVTTHKISVVVFQMVIPIHDVNYNCGFPRSPNQLLHLTVQIVDT